jgi:xanthosine utilization system XapX-like protein
MGGFVLAWFAGESIVVYRWVKLKAPPPPGALLLASGVFVGLAVLGQYQPARMTATVAAWAFDLAILLQVVGKAPTQVTGWPPNLITDPTVLLPTGNAAAASQPAAAAPSAPAVKAKGGPAVGSAAWWKELATGGI